MTREPTFPPLINGVMAPSGGNPSEIACRAAGEGHASAGDLYWSPSETTLSLALVLEPELPAEQALDMLFVAMVAFGDSVGALAPPEVGITYAWPQTLLANGARVGCVKLQLPPGARADGEPDWMVMALSAEISPAAGMVDPGRYVDRTSLWDEGCGGLTRTDLLESFVRHLKTWIHRWETDGVRPVREAWLARAAKPGEAVSCTSGGQEQSGTFLGLDDAGNLMLKAGEETIVAGLADSLQPNPYRQPEEAGT